MGPRTAMKWERTLFFSLQLSNYIITKQTLLLLLQEERRRRRNRWWWWWWILYVWLDTETEEQHSRRTIFYYLVFYIKLPIIVMKNDRRHRRRRCICRSIRKFEFEWRRPHTKRFGQQFDGGERRSCRSAGQGQRRFASNSKHQHT